MATRCHFILILSVKSKEIYLYTQCSYTFICIELNEILLMSPILSHYYRDFCSFYVSCLYVKSHYKSELYLLPFPIYFLNYLILVYIHSSVRIVKHYPLRKTLMIIVQCLCARPFVSWLFNWRDSTHLWSYLSQQILPHSL